MAEMRDESCEMGGLGKASLRCCIARAPAAVLHRDPLIQSYGTAVSQAVSLALNLRTQVSNGRDAHIQAMRAHT